MVVAASRSSWNERGSESRRRSPEEVSLTPRELLVAYLAALADVIVALHLAVPWVGRVGSPGVLMGRTIAGEYVREGVLPTLGEFSFHGVGCLVERLDGGLIDFDWDAGGRVVFDPYRVRRFGRSLGVLDLEEIDLLHECQLLVDEGKLLASSEGWFVHA